MRFTIILQNNTSKKEYILENLINLSVNNLYIKFENIDLDLQDGEYTLVCFANDRTDCTYEIYDDLKNTVIHTTDGDCKLADINAYWDIMRVGEIKDKYTSKNKDTEYYYRKK